MGPERRDEDNCCNENWLVANQAGICHTPHQTYKRGTRPFLGGFGGTSGAKQ